MNSDVHRHQAHPPLAQVCFQHGVHTGAQSVGCGWYSASTAPAPTAPARVKRAQPPPQLPTGGGGVVISNGPHVPLSPTALQNSIQHNLSYSAKCDVTLGQQNVMSSSVRAAAPAGPAPAPAAMHTSQTTPAVSKGASDVLVNSSANPPAATRLVNMSQWPWHHGAISRERAEALLSGSPDGVFLVRESTNFPGDHTLCVRFRGRVEHYRVKWATAPDSQTQRLTIDDEEFFDTMTDLIHHYLQDADGLCTKLVRCLPKAAINGANNNGVLQPPYPPHPPQPPPYPPTPSVSSALSSGHFQHTYAAQAPPSADQTDSAQHQRFVDARWIIAERDLEIRENIGKGEFGDVMLGILNGNQKVAVKILKDREAASKFRAEASVMSSLKHDNLVRLLGCVVFSSNGSTCIVTEHCAQGSLLDYLRSRGRHYVTQQDQINFAFDACCGMEYLERQRVVHRDLAARNVLISAEGTAKVADFGLARCETAPEDPADAMRVQAKLPIKWTAPEALKYNKFSNKSDMWSFGILLWEIYSFGRVPYPRIPLAEVVRHVERGYRMEAPEGCPAGPYDVMRAAWHADPQQRPTFAATRARLAAMRDALHHAHQ
ncbi:PREDICTED: tyrosine-protein kinase CSK-like isoform X1 [Papilio xuthus]|uniref:Tyrosine-protein kinase n=1 Tax=Papilio xuthus TaxID=66420 RepID=A0AAJ6ZD82_PAPXU|nr:PREDICTED: tyrosine-protein kinase CSK-like isoform X1 [Papilio xuthus]XP_013169955.1 PREDICTED: tyrosine-protein kinase CSK-like isoform X1 [Papilio xuthus]